MSRRIANTREKQEEEDNSLGSFMQNVVLPLGIIGGLAIFGGIKMYQWIQSWEDYLFHYTNEDGFRAIRGTRRIYKSAGRTDASFGHGVYLTSLHPREGTTKILRNNYNSASSSRRDNANCFFRFKKTDLPGARKQNSERDVWLYPQDIDLRCLDYDCGQLEATVVLNHDKHTGELKEVNFSR